MPRTAPAALARPDLRAGERTAAFTGSLHLKTDDVDSLWARLKDRVRICYPIETFDYGMREFAIYDNNGYVLQFGQPLPAPRQP